MLAQRPSPVAQDGKSTTHNSAGTTIGLHWRDRIQKQSTSKQSTAKQRLRASHNSMLDQKVRGVISDSFPHASSQQEDLHSQQHQSLCSSKAQIVWFLLLLRTAEASKFQLLTSANTDQPMTDRVLERVHVLRSRKARTSKMVDAGHSHERSALGCPVDWSRAGRNTTDAAQP